MRSITWMGLVLLGAGCGGDQGVTQDVEGDEAEECRDGADNDQDGYFDCDDQGCWGSPDCADVGTDDSGHNTGDETGSGGDDTGSGGDDSGSGGDDSGSTTDASAILTAEITMRVEWDVPDGTGLIEDCTRMFEGSAQQIGAEGERVYMQGSWAEVPVDPNVYTPCSEYLGYLVWFPEDGAAYHTFEFLGELDRIDLWTAHEDEGDYLPTWGDKWTLFDLRAPVVWPAGTAHVEDYHQEVVDGYTYRTDFIVDFVFTRE
ncbi:MAG: hypothetical protein H6740_18300 [Alphaproteobacteria bacterium]|nr:hypothetical protein [Alphaproteobacteria bacterium]